MVLLLLLGVVDTILLPSYRYKQGKIQVCTNRFQDEKYQLQLGAAKREDARQKVADLEIFLGELEVKVEEYDEALVRRLIERVTVYDDHFTVEFKSGIEIDVQ